ncbi:hypothetical protein CGLO_01941 [Colletotrichum gloeosporioides Cg-14]|uniref:Uncharacterized protein n=1 Tax=Colletotrichum gloeosporioides (strain Cg-14) TaxID=1237896 RepID=T0MA53_COLGC|nr:hypothetical protein CGLO_01941 [Colletotrichum gloeosporioides Cg-14]
MHGKATANWMMGGVRGMEV